MDNPTSAPKTDTNRTSYRERIYAKYASGFQDAAEEFDAASAERWGRAYDHYFRRWLPENKDVAICDLACGGGGLLHFFKRRGYARIAGTDISEEQVHIARQVTPEVMRTDVLEFLETRPNSFDLITALDLIEHLHKDEVLRLLDGCRRALKPAGRLILQTPNAESPCGPSIRYGDFTHEIGFTPGVLRRLMGLCGFTEIEAREQGPVPWGYSLLSSARYVLWRALRLGLIFYNRVETGDGGSGIFTRVFLISGRKS